MNITGTLSAKYAVKLYGLRNKGAVHGKCAPWHQLNQILFMYVHMFDVDSFT